MKAALLIALTLLPLAGFSQSNNGLVAHWLFTGNAFDSTGNGHNGTMNNVTFTTGRAGNVNTAVRFNGSDTSHITAPYTSDLNLVNYSLCALVKPEGFYTNTCQISILLTRGEMNTTGNYYLDFFDNAYDSSCSNADTNNYLFHTGAGPSNYPPHAPWQYSPAVHTNQWYSVVTTFDGAKFKVYVNGQLKSTAIPNSVTAIGTSKDSLSIGGTIFGNVAQYPYWFKGVIDDLRIYNRVLADSEIVKYNALDSPTSVSDIASAGIGLSVFPNPNTGVFTLEGPVNDGSLTVEVYNIVGQPVYRTITMARAGQLKEKIDLASVA